MVFDLAHAIRRNAYWSGRLGWTQHRTRIADHLGRPVPTAADLAAAISDWQSDRDPPLGDDGIIGPRTWRVLQQEIGLTQQPAPRSEDGAFEVHSLLVRGQRVTFYDFIGVEGTHAKIERLRPVLEGMPVTHLERLYPIFLVERHRHQGAAQAGTGGGATLRLRDMRHWGRRHSENTAIPAEMIERVVVRGRGGMITIPRHRWTRDFTAVGGAGFVVPHEIGHCIDAELHLRTSRTRTTDFPGVEHSNRYCGAGSGTGRQVSEVYRKLLVSPRNLFHQVPAHMSAEEANRQIMETIRASPAFRDVPDSWGPQY